MFDGFLVSEYKLDFFLFLRTKDATFVKSGSIKVKKHKHKRYIN